MQAKEQELLAESQTLERYTSMFQTFVDSLNNQIAAQNTLINKLTIDTEQRIVLYKALEDGERRPPSRMWRTRSTRWVRRSTRRRKRPWPASARPRSAISAISLEMHEKNMLATQDIQRLRKLADDAFARRFQAVMDKHNTANYVKQ